jgi:TRAP-type transport system periplasmic protein
MMTKALGRALAAAFTVAILAPAGMAQAQNQEWRIATLAPDGSSWVKVLSRGAQEIEQATDGRIKIRYFTGGVQGDEKDAVRKMEIGQLDGAALTSVGLSLIDESIRVLELPRLFESEAELDYVRDKMWPTFRRRFAQKGYHLGDPGDVGFIYLYSNTPINSEADLKTIRMWRWTEDQIVRALFQKLGVSGVPLGVPDVLPALNTGRINACYSSPYAMVALQWYTQVRYSTSVPMSYAIGASVVKKDKWDAVSKADVDKIQRIMRVQGRQLRQTIRRDNRRARTTIGRTIKEVATPQALVDRIDTAAQQVWREQAGKIYPKADLDLVLKHRDEFRAKQKK